MNSRQKAPSRNQKRSCVCWWDHGGSPLVAHTRSWCRAPLQGSIFPSGEKTENTKLVRAKLATSIGNLWVTLETSSSKARRLAPLGESGLRSVAPDGNKNSWELTTFPAVASIIVQVMQCYWLSLAARGSPWPLLTCAGEAAQWTHLNS